MSALTGYAALAYKSLCQFYLYSYDGSSSHINDGGYDMYDTGNQVRKQMTLDVFLNLDCYSYEPCFSHAAFRESKWGELSASDVQHHSQVRVKTVKSVYALSDNMVRH